MMKITDIDALEELITIGRQYQAAEQRLADAERYKNAVERQAALAEMESLEAGQARLQGVIAELDAAIEHAEEAEEPGRLAAGLVRKGLLLARLDRGPEAVELFDRALALLENGGQTKLRVELTVRRAMTLGELGRMLEADASLDEMLSELGSENVGLRTGLLAYKGDLYLASGREDRAQRAYEDAIAASGSNKKSDGVEQAKVGLAKALVRQQKLEPAAQFLRETLAHAQATGNLERQGEALLELQAIDLGLGDIEAYLQDCTLARRIAERRGDHVEVAIQRENAVKALLNLDRPSEAIALLLESLEYVRRRGPRMKKLVIMMQLGKIYYEVGRLDDAESVFQDVLEEAQDQNNPRTMAVALGRLGALYAERGELEAALRYGELALEKVDEEIDPEIVAEQQVLLALTYQDLGQLEQAASACEKAIDLYGSLGYDELAENARQLLTELAPAA